MATALKEDTSESVIDTEAIRAWLAANLGEVEWIELQPRWRPMWYADVRRGGELLKLCVRGDRIDTTQTFSLHHEMTVQKLMQDHGVRVARVYGWMDGLDAYVMDRVPGEHTLAGLSDGERDAIMRDYMRELAQVHAIPVATAEAAGIEGGRTPEEASRFVIDRFRDTYRDMKVRPDPFVEFVLGYLDRNLVAAQDRRKLIVWDSGQFLQHEGQFQAAIDLEVAHIGDPMSDLGMLVARDPTMNFGSMQQLFRWYEEFSGTKIDPAAIRMHHLFGLLTCPLSFHAALADPPVDSHMTNNLKWVHVNSCATIDIMALHMGIALPEVEMPAPRNSPWRPAYRHMTNLLKSMKPAEQYQRYQFEQLVALSEHLDQVDAVGDAVTEANLDDIGALLGTRPATWTEGDAALERYVLADNGAHDRELLLLFNRRVNRFRLLNGRPNTPITERRKYQIVE